MTPALVTLPVTVRTVTRKTIMISVIPAGLEPATLRFRKGINAEGFQVDRSESTRQGHARSDADSRGLSRPRRPACARFYGRDLCELLNAQAVWLATRDPAALRRKLIEMLAALG